MTSAAETPSSSWMPTGMPRPLSVTVTRAVGVEGHGDRVAIAGQRLVDRVVDDLVDHVVQAGAVIGVADIHARPLAHGVEPAQHLDRLLVVGLVVAIAGAVAVSAVAGAAADHCIGMPRGRVGAPVRVRIGCGMFAMRS